jgi:hypothetical protein
MSTTVETRLLDPEDERLTAGERHQLRQILFRLQGRKPPQPREDSPAPRPYRPDSLEAAIDEIFGEVKFRRT